jgi:exonuclease VII small subunit
MEDRLLTCSSYLEEVEEKLIELLQSPTDSDPEEKAAKVSEALHSVRRAQKELFAAQANIEVSLTALQ